MATLKEQIVLEIKGLCRNKTCAELAADIAIKNVEALKPSHNTDSPKLLADNCLCDHWWWRSTGFMFCPTCGKQLRAGA